MRNRYKPDYASLRYGGCVTVIGKKYPRFSIVVKVIFKICTLFEDNRNFEFLYKFDIIDG